MKVFKFGGASIENIERVKNVVSIISDYAQEPLLVVISAKGKTTNALEKIAEAFYAGEKDNALDLLAALELDHYQYAEELLGGKDFSIFAKLQELFTEVHWTLDELPQRTYDYYHDQIVSVGELLSTSIIAEYMNSIHMKAEWIDVRDVMKTDSVYRDAGIDWDLTTPLAKSTFFPIVEKGKVVITQGYIGCTDENNSVTLGREGSDYTAAVFANILDADSVTIWKDVPSLLNADPKIFPNTVPIEVITFSEVIEMAFYGAQVIHPKTIKPLQNKDIPLYVKCFLDRNLKGTKICNSREPIQYPPIMVLKTNQLLLQVTTRDYSFITEDNLSRIYTLFHHHKIKINLIQNAAISFVACIDNQADKLKHLLADLDKEYQVKLNENLFLFTVRHYTQHALKEELKNRTVLLTQKTRQTIQLVVK